ncbi:MAG: hypothetical protein P1V20_01480 [Verrucomicrobiales bacterium]|nr:hypothetical protein [Verrucomicrobiales bacterium]
MPPIKPKQPETHKENWIAAISCAVYVISHLFLVAWWGNSSWAPLTEESFTSLLVFGAILPLASTIGTIVFYRKKLINGTAVFWIGVAISLCLIAVWAYFFLVAWATAQI